MDEDVYMENKLEYEYYSEVTARNVEWLWYPYIPYGKITLLQGDPGEGKSTFILNLAAIITRGGILPDGKKLNSMQSVIYQCAEDNNEDTIKPRLVQAGADCSKVAFIIENDKNVTLDDSRLEEIIIATKARVLVLDPIQAFIPPESDMQNAIKMRKIMRHLSDIAEKYNCAIILVGHMNKASGGKNLYRSLGSIDIAAIARSILMIERDINNPEMRYMFTVKSSLAPEGKAIGFMFNPVYGFQWLGECSRNNSKIIKKDRKKKKDRAKELLYMLLSVNDLPSLDVYQRLSKAGISERTVRNAQKELGIKAYRKRNIWYWHLETGED